MSIFIDRNTDRPLMDSVWYLDINGGGGSGRKWDSWLCAYCHLSFIMLWLSVWASLSVCLSVCKQVIYNNLNSSRKHRKSQSQYWWQMHVSWSTIKHKIYKCVWQFVSMLLWCSQMYCLRCQGSARLRPRLCLPSGLQCMRPQCLSLQVMGPKGGGSM